MFFGLFELSQFSRSRRSWALYLRFWLSERVLTYPRFPLRLGQLFHSGLALTELVELHLVERSAGNLGLAFLDDFIRLVLGLWFSAARERASFFAFSGTRLRLSLTVLNLPGAENGLLCLGLLRALHFLNIL